MFFSVFNLEFLVLILVHGFIHIIAMVFRNINVITIVIDIIHICRIGKNILQPNSLFRQRTQ